MTRRFVSLGALLLILGFLAAPTSPAAAQDARAFVSDLGTRAIEVLGPHVSQAQRVARFRQLFTAGFDVPGIGQFVLGRYWRTATPQEQQEFLRLFQEYVVQAYAARLGEYGGEPFRVTGSRPAGAETVVSSEILRGNGNRIQLDWHLINQSGRLKISDVYVAGVSMKVTQRDEFASVIQHSGGRVEGLLARLRQKLAALQ